MFDLLICGNAYNQQMHVAAAACVFTFAHVHVHAHLTFVAHMSHMHGHVRMQYTCSEVIHIMQATDTHKTTCSTHADANCTHADKFGTSCRDLQLDYRSS